MWFGPETPEEHEGRPFAIPDLPADQER